MVNVAAAIEQDGFNELASTNTISFTKSITSHNLFVIVVSYQIQIIHASEKLLTVSIISNIIPWIC